MSHDFSPSFWRASIGALRISHRHVSFLEGKHLPSSNLLHSYGKSQFYMGKTTINGQFSIAMLNYQRVLSGLDLSHKNLESKLEESEDKPQLWSGVKTRTFEAAHNHIKLDVYPKWHLIIHHIFWHSITIFYNIILFMKYPIEIPKKIVALFKKISQNYELNGLV